MSSTAPSADRASWLAPLTVGLLAAVLTAACYGEGALGLGRLFPSTDFDGGHALFVDMLLRGEWSPVVERMAFPVGSVVRYIGFAMVPLSAPGWLLGDIAVGYVLGLWLGVGLSAGVGAWILRRLSGLDAWAAAALALPMALSPYVVGSLANGQMAKIHLWLTLLTLAALTSLRPGRLATGSALLFVVAAITSLNSPSVGLSLPFVAAGVVMADLPGQGWRQRVMPNVLRLGATALALVPTWAYHRSGFPDPHSGTHPIALDPVFALTPSMRAGGLGAPTTPLPVAEPLDMLLGVGFRDPEIGHVTHVTYLLLPCLALAIWGLFRARAATQREPRRLGSLLLLGGAGLALGPVLAWGEDYVQAGGYLVPLPAIVLEWVQYPLSESGKYYRMISLAYVGSALLGALGLASLSVPRARLVAAGVALVGMLDGFRSTRELLPIPCTPVEDRATYEAMAEDEVEGAVLDLPLLRTMPQADRGLLRAAMSKRDTTLYPMIPSGDAQPHLLALHHSVREALRSSRPHAALWAQGFRYVVFDPSIGPVPEDPHAHPQSREAQRMEDNPVGEQELRRALGAPTFEGSFLVWRVER